MLSSQNPDHPANEVPAGPTLDDLVERARRLRQDVDTARLADTPGGAEGGAAPGSAAGIRHAGWAMAAHRLDEAADQLDQLRAATAPDGRARLGMRVGSAEWDLLTDDVVWSEELFSIFGRAAQDGPLSLDQLPSWLPAEDQPALTAAVTGCLVDGRPVDCEFRITRPDGSERTVQMAGEPVLDDHGGTVAMWAMIRDVSELRRGELAHIADHRPHRHGAA
ncbi:PAS domain-containing protein, partial [Streptomyces sp. SBT349]|uniref:PAS domain-containing protein n=1 Tax=Streptomyces sp. SBT349 TaxID=1580539 RepID=UPI00066B6FB8